MLAVASVCYILPAAVRAEDLPPAMAILIQAVSKSSDPSSQLNMLRGINAALKGKHGLPAPAGWDALYAKLNASANDEIRQQAQSLAIVFGGGGAMDELRKTLLDPKADFDRRKAALDSIASTRDLQALPAIVSLLAEPGPLRRPALHALASFDDPKLPEAILAGYAGFTSDEKREALSTLVARPAWARAIITGLDAKTIARSDVSTPVARQLSELNDPQIGDWLKKNWGAMRSSPADKQQQIARLKAVLTPSYMARGDAPHGRALFSQTCVLCHTLFGTGAKIGPELPGAFDDIDYLLLNIIDPNAIIGKDYQQTVIETKDGQTLVGIVGDQDSSSVTLKSLAGLQTVQRADIKSLTVLDTSLMPEGLLSAMKDEDVRDLFSYLKMHGQTPCLISAASINDFFDGADLNRWIPSRAKAWSVQSGEIVGRAECGETESLTSDMIAPNCRLTFQLKFSGHAGSAEVRYRGQEVDGGFQGCGLRLSGNACENVRYEQPGKGIAGAAIDENITPGSWASFDVILDGSGVRLLLNGKPLFADAKPPGGNRSVFEFAVSGKDSELRVKGLHIELLHE